MGVRLVDRGDKVGICRLHERIPVGLPMADVMLPAAAFMKTLERLLEMTDRRIRAPRPHYPRPYPPPARPLPYPPPPTHPPPAAGKWIWSTSPIPPPPGDPQARTPWYQVSAVPPHILI